jgi:predicted N-acetyltransferase YhbS
MGITIRSAGEQDAEGLAALLADYLSERFPGHRGTSAEELRRDVLGPTSTHIVLVAQRGELLVGFIAWDAVYDLHWAVHGAQVADFYVTTAERGRGAALQLITGLCAEGQRRGAKFLRGSSYPRQSRSGRFYERLAIGADSAECHCSGRAFRTLAPSELVRQ